ncbi:MFS transporter [Prauserella cavernicola]|uniref:MFS transporter n=1 Tax=Prauserella cavernicola TaxID=2800127 RepID=A0A934QSE3_9PSEU|nr:MFS transporter [Prauserella cavernicola]MBK1785796.1 MFS transporter [Prauserella cavernicola]
MKPGLGAPLRRHRDFRALLAGRTAAELGNAIAPVALAFTVLDLTGSLTDLGLVVGARSVANVLLLLVGGVLADRLPRGVILQGTEYAAMATQALLALSVLSGHASIPVLIALAAVNGAVAAMSLPAAASLTPQTVSPDLLAPANALVRMAANTGRITGAALGGALIAATAPGWAMVANSVVFLAAALAYRRVRVRGPRRTERTNPLADLAAGWREFSSRSWVWLVVVQFMVVNAVLAGCLVVLGPSVADDTFGRAGWGLVLAANTVGAFAGGVLAARWQPKRALRIGVAVAVFDAVPLALLAELPHVVPLVIAMFLAGVALEQFVVAWDVSLQENIAEDKLARVYSYDMLGSFIALPVGEVTAGPLAESVGVEATLLGGAALLTVVTLLVLLSPSIRGLERRPVPA